MFEVPVTIDIPEESQSGDQVIIRGDLTIPLRELRFRTSRSGGPGGQYVNRTETRVELLFDVANSASLSDDQRARIMERLQGRLDSEGVLHVVSTATRSQLENRANAVARFQALLQAALRPAKKRLATRPTAAARERRLKGKSSRSETKARRRFNPLGED
jgi:ribosome-associated protein